MRNKVLIYALVIFLISFYIPSTTISNDTITVSSYYWGSRGKTVLIIQDKLKRGGYYKGNVDGIYGQLTVNSVKWFQRANNIRETGICDKETLEALGIFEETGGQATSNHENQVWTLASLIYAEARGESYIGQVAIGAVILNRVEHPAFPNTISGVIYQPGAFEVVTNGQNFLIPNKSCLNAARDALNGFDPVDGAIYYWNPAKTTNKWILSIPVTKVIGNHAFGRR